MTATYAAATEVSSDRSRTEIERILVRFGASQFGYGWSGDMAVIGFTARDRAVRFTLPLPSRDADVYRRTPKTRVLRSESARLLAWEQDCRARWRALALVIKAKLAAIEVGIVTFEQEFGMHIVLPDGRMVADQVVPAIDAAYASGSTPRLLELGS